MNLNRSIEGKRGKLNKKNQITMLFFLCFFAYFSTYLGRLNYSASLAELIRVEGIPKGEAGLIGTFFFFSYGIGQGISGFLGDRLKGKWMVFVGIAASGILNGCMGMAHSIQLMCSIWCLNGLAQALIWSPLLRILYDYLEVDALRRCCLYINFSVPLGTITSYALTATLLQTVGWRPAFLMPCFLLLGMATLWLIGMGWLEHISSSQESVMKSPIQGDYKEFDGKKNNKKLPISGVLAASGLYLLMGVLCVQGALKDGVTTWIPTYLRETHNLGPMTAVLSTMVIPLCNLFGISLASLVDRKLGRNEILTSCVFLGTCGVALTVLRYGGEDSAVLALLMLAISTTCMMAVNTMLIAVLPSRFGKLGKVSSVTGILNSCVYIGCAVSTYGIGALSSSYGWNATILFWAIGAFVALIACFGTNKRWKQYTNEVLK